MAGESVSKGEDIQSLDVDDGNETLFGSIKKGCSSPQILIGDVFSGAVIGFINATQIVPMAALIFAGALAVFVPDIFSVYLICGIVGALIAAAFSGYKTMVSEPRMVHLPIYIAMSVGVSTAMKGAEPEAIAITILAVIMLSSLVVGIVLYLFGHMNLGAIARFVPLPVTAGILASMGILVCVSAIEFATAPDTAITDPASFFTLDNYKFLSIALIFGFALNYCTNKFAHWAIPILFLLVGTIGFYAVCYLLDIDANMAQQLGWLPSIDSSSSSAINLTIFSYENIKLIDLSAVFSQSFIILSFVFLTVILVLLEIAAIEVNLGRELNTNKELMINGKSNIAISALGGATAIPATTDTLLLSKLGGQTFMSIVSYCLFFGFMMTYGMKFLTIVPNFVFSGFILISGVPLVQRWFFGQYRTLPKSEFFMIICIILGVVFFGIIEGFVIGALLAVCLFVYNYSKLDSIKHCLDRSQIVGIFDRSVEEQQILDQKPERLQIFRLQGFLFFGSSHNALTTIKSRLAQYANGAVSYLILDFHYVDSLDTSAVNSFLKLFKLSKVQNLTVVVSGCDGQTTARLQNAYDSLELTDHTLKFVANLDEAVGWSDDNYLAGFELNIESNEQIFEHWLQTIVRSDADIGKIVDYFDVIELNENDTLFQQGDAGDALYFIAEGQIDIFINVDDHPLKVRAMKKGSILGEMTLLKEADRTASAIAVDTCKLFRLSKENFAEMQESYPSQTLSLVSFIANVMSERLNRANLSISALRK